jgi:transposase
MAAIAKHFGAHYTTVSRLVRAFESARRGQFDDPKSGMVAAYATGDYTLQVIADAFGVHYSTVRQAVSGK